jgi:F-type H+-transporting ATPase subunit delta
MKLAAITGKEVLVTAEQNPELIGGVVTHLGDLVYDGSIRTLLENMRERLAKG